MANAGTMCGYGAMLLVVVMGARWLQLMQRVQIPNERGGYVAVSGLAVLLGVSAFVLGTSAGGGIAGAFAVVGASAFLALHAASGQPAVPPAVKVGGRVLDFIATDDAGQPFDLSQLRGRPFLLKFFRGHWCPYCTAELRRWEELRAEFDARNIAIVTVCADTAEQIRAGRHKHGLQAVMLPDPMLTITDHYGLRSPKNFAPKPGVIIPLPIPTAILVDASGVVRWIDQATDYMTRSDPARVRRAIRSTLGTAVSASADSADRAEYLAKTGSARR